MPGPLRLLLLGVALVVFIFSLGLLLTRSLPRQNQTASIPGEYLDIEGESPSLTAQPRPTGPTGVLPTGIATPRPGWVPYRVRPGDTLSGLSSRLGVSPEVILEANPELENAGSIEAGTVIYLPPTTPAATFVPGATPTPLPRVMVRYEWPERMEVGRSGSVIISLVQTGGQPIELKVEVTDNAAKAATAVPAGTEEAPVERAFGEEYDAYAAAKLAGSTFDYEPVTPEQQPLVPGQDLSWEWNIVSNQAGPQTISASVEALWISKDGQQTVKRQVIWRDRMRVTVEKPLITLGQLNVLTLASGLISTGLSIPWLYGLIKERRAKKPAEKKRPPGKVTRKPRGEG